jgi:nitrogen fixation protein FixH
MNRELTGRHVFFITAGAFAVIIGVNVVMAVSAVRTFPGLEVKNSYVASQTFDADRAAQEALGWTVNAEVDDDLMRLAITDRSGRPVEPAALSVLIGRTTSTADDQRPALDFDGSAFVAPVALGSGLWTLRIEAEAADGTAFRQRLSLRVKPRG